MKNLKFSRLFAAVMFVACLVLVGCKQPTDDNGSQPAAVETPVVITPAPSSSESIIGTWKSTYDEVFIVTTTSVKENAFMFWEMNIEEFDKIGENAGVIYGKLTKGTEWTPADTYYAFAYKDLVDNTCKIASAASSYATLAEVKAACTIENMFTYYSECSKQ